MKKIIAFKPKKTEPTTYPPLPAVQWLNALIRVRRTVRYQIGRIEINRAIRSNMQRSANKLKAENNPFNAHRIKGLEDTVSELAESCQTLRSQLIEIGKTLMQSASHIDNSVPQPLMASFLEINIADRSEIEPTDGFAQLAFARGLESSAYYRGDDWKKGPFAVAMEAFMQHEMIHNEELSKQMQDIAFGPGGMFEFIPMYKENDKGEMVRLPPKLRVVNSEAA